MLFHSHSHLCNFSQKINIKSNRLETNFSSKLHLTDFERKALGNVQVKNIYFCQGLFSIINHLKNFVQFPFFAITYKYKEA